jgi:hypothetical protein
MGPRLTKQQRAALAKVEAQTEQHNELMQAHIDRQARGLDPITGEPAMGKPAIPWVRGNRETWILELIAEYQRHFQETGNRYFVLAAYDAATYLTDRAAHKLVLSWVDVGLGLIVRRLLAGVDNPLRDSPLKRGERSLYEQAKKKLRDGALAIKVLNRLPVERGNETLAIKQVAIAEQLSPTVVGDAWREFKKRRQR